MTYRDEQVPGANPSQKGRSDIKSDLFYREDDGECSQTEWSCESRRN
jgi:hypothetical protein